MTTKHGDISRWRTIAQKAGWRITKTPRGHERWYPADKTQPPATVPCSPGGGRSMSNTKAQLRLRGLAI